MDLLTPEQVALLKTLMEDVQKTWDKMRSEPQEAAYWRRAFVRGVFALHEAVAFVFRQVVLKKHNDQKVSLDQREIDALAEKQYEINQSGRFEEREAKVRTAHLIAYSVRMVARVCGVPDEQIQDAIFGVQGWQAFRGALRLRDKLMHPKDASALTIGDQELTECRESVQWMFNALHLATLANLRQAGVPEDKLHEVEQAIMDALPSHR